jgi:3-methyladenine DNA glycosylase/8-oxoguanine DNA glycosylase
VARDAITPRGPVFDPRPITRRPLRVLRGGARGVVASLRASAGRVVVELLAASPLEPEEVEAALVMTRASLGLDDDATGFLDVARRHPRVAELARVHDTRLGVTPTVFEAFVVAVIEQLVTGFEAKGSVRRLWSTAGERVGETALHAAPTPAAVRRVPMWRLREMGIGARRAATLRTGALRGAAIERLRAVGAEVALARLQSLPGVGPWTANYVALRAFGWADAVPVGDAHAHYLVTEALTGVQGDDDAMVRALEPFRPHRARVVLLIMSAVFGRDLPAVRRPRPPRVDAHRREPWRF